MIEWEIYLKRGAGFGLAKRKGVFFTPVKAFSASNDNGNGKPSRTMVCKLDTKHRLVLPAIVRAILGLNGSVILSLDGSQITLRKPQQTLEEEEALPISRNCSEVME